MASISDAHTLESGRLWCQGFDVLPHFARLLSQTFLVGMLCDGPRRSKVCSFRSALRAAPSSRCPPPPSPWLPELFCVHRSVSVCSPHCRFCALRSAACTRRPSIPLPSRSASADCAQRTQVSMQRLRITILLKVLCRCSSFIDLRCMFSNDLQLAGVAFSKRLLGAQHRWCQ